VPFLAKSSFSSPAGAVKKSTSEAARAYTSFYELFLDFLVDGDFWEIGACAGEPDGVEYRAEVAPVAAHGAFNGGF